VSNAFSRSAAYDQGWVSENSMGPNALWLTESLCQRLDLRAGMRVLDLGCGKAISSIFLAREFDVQVWATDLWIRPTENLVRIQEAGAQERVFPIYSDARALPFAQGFFDAIVSVDAYHYFGTDDLYLEYLVRFLTPGGQIGIICPALRRELAGDVPEYLYQSYTYGGGHTFHSPEWWRNHWAKTGLVEVRYAEAVPEAQAIWEEFARRSPAAREEVRADKSALMTFSRVVATRL
jgi:cyclopropane fatty-acyl-phospholipid synthase-like methyltransferase